MMDEHLFDLFRVEVKSQLELALAAAERLRTPQNTDAFWFTLQGTLLVAGNLAKLLWGSQGPAKERERKPLRDLLGVSDESPLKRRAVRNSFEHFDERLEAWFNRGDTKVFSSRNIGEHSMPKDAQFGNYDPDKKVLNFGEDEISIPDLVEEMDRIWATGWPEDRKRRGPITLSR